MKSYEVTIRRHQTQSVTFTVKSDNEKALRDKLEEIDLGEIDGRFDEGEVESIEYETTEINRVKGSEASFADEDLQDLLD